MLIALIDMDIVVYRCAASAEEEDESVAISRCDFAMSDILARVNADSYEAFLTGSNNFRKQINPEYKANRKDKPLPKHLNLLREHAVTEWKSEVTDGYEADDALGIQQSTNKENQRDSVICSIDKDLDMIPGKHFNWVKGDYYEVSDIEAYRSFYRSLYVGDISDHLFGIRGIGKVKAAKIIDPLETQVDMIERVSEDYYAIDNSFERLEMNSRCLWIWRKEGDNILETWENIGYKEIQQRIQGIT